MRILSQLIAQILEETRAQDNPYFVSLQNGTFDKEDFVETQMQFFFAVIFFSRPMAALAAKIPSPELRLDILRNVWEEHGDGRLSDSHGKTFLEFLKRLAGVSEIDVLHRGLWPEVRIFNTTLSGMAVLDDFLMSVSALGMIERMFSDISAWIGTAVTARSWISSENMIHYKLHQELDIKHSDDFFKIVESSYQKSAENRYHVEQGLRLGSTLFNSLYHGLWMSRKRRWVLAQPFPPSRSADYVP